MSKAEKDRKRRDAQRKLYHIKYDIVAISTKLSKLNPSNSKHLNIINHLYDVISAAKFKLDDEILYAELEEARRIQKLEEEGLSPDLEGDSLKAFAENIEASLDRLSDRDRRIILSELPNFNFDEILADQVLKLSHKGSSRTKKSINPSDDEE